MMDAWLWIYWVGGALGYVISMHVVIVALYTGVYGQGLAYR
jgi:hypothetical protein